MPAPTAKRVGPITSKVAGVNNPSWNDYELLNFHKNFLNPGVANKAGGDFAVTQRGAGANMSVDVAPGNALVQITNTNIDGTTYNVPFFCGVTTNVAVSAADPTNPRIDLLVLKVDVSQDPDVGSGNIALFTVVTGTPAVSPAVPAVPANSTALAQWTVAAGATSIVNANITDRRTAVDLKSNVLPGLAQATETAALRNDTPMFVTSTGSANAYVGTYTPAHTSLVVGQRFEFKANFANTGACTFNPDGLGAKTIKKGGGQYDLISGDIPNGAIVVLKWDGTNMQLVSVAATIPGSIALVARVFFTTTHSTTSTTFVDVDASMTVNVTTTASSILVITLSGPFYQAGNYGAIDFSVGGSRLGDATFGLFYTEGTTAIPCSLSHTYQPGAGTFTVKPQWKAGAAGTAKLGNGSQGPTYFEVLQIG